MNSEKTSLFLVFIRYIFTQIHHSNGAVGIFGSVGFLILVTFA